jgi:hypothetical protein
MRGNRLTDLAAVRFGRTPLTFFSPTLGRAILRCPLLPLVGASSLPSGRPLRASWAFPHAG